MYGVTNTGNDITILDTHHTKWRPTMFTGRLFLYTREGLNYNVNEKIFFDRSDLP